MIQSLRKEVKEIYYNLPPTIPLPPPIPITINL